MQLVVAGATRIIRQRLPEIVVAERRDSANRRVRLCQQGPVFRGRGSSECIGGSGQERSAQLPDAAFVTAACGVDGIERGSGRGIDAS
jgi:hypothetical protein